MRYLVTGGAGFIGSHVVDALLARGEEVVVFDDLSTGSEENLNPAASFVKGTILDLEAVVPHVGPGDVVIHLAAAVGVKRILERPLESFLTNIRGTEHVLEAASLAGATVFLASTSEIYGDSRAVSFREDADHIGGNPQVLRWGYSLSKAADETLAFAYARQRGLKIVIGRFFNTVGPRQSGAYGMVLPNLVEQAVSGRELTVYGDGSQSRCFCHVSDVVDAILALLEEPAAVGEVFNIGSDEEISIRRLAEKVIELSGSTSGIELVPYERAYEQDFVDVRRRVPDISKIGRTIGWKPSRSLDEILLELIALQRGPRSR